MTGFLTIMMRRPPLQGSLTVVDLGAPFSTVDVTPEALAP